MELRKKMEIRKVKKENKLEHIPWLKIANPAHSRRYLMVFDPLTSKRYLTFWPLPKAPGGGDPKKLCGCMCCSCK